MSFAHKFTKRDLVFALVTGLFDGLVIWQIFKFLHVGQIHGLPWGSLVIILPVLWILGVLLGYLLGQWLNFFDQFGRFAVIGFTNTTVDFGILNFLISWTGSVAGSGFALNK